MTSRSDTPCCPDCERRRFFLWARRAAEPSRRDELVDEVVSSIAGREPRGVAVRLCVVVAALVEGRERAAIEELNALEAAEIRTLRANPGERACPGRRRLQPCS